MFLRAGFNPRGKAVCWANVRAGDGFPRWTRLFQFKCGEMAWVGRRFGFAQRDAQYVCSMIELPRELVPKWSDARHLWSRPHEIAAQRQTEEVTNG